VSTTRGSTCTRLLRIGILGAAAIAPSALIRPAELVEGVKVVAIAARDQKRAQEFAKKHKIPRVHKSYEDLLADSEVDAVYNPLPNSLHKEWTIRALKAGKHVLCEKPLACNEEEVEEMFKVAKEQDRLVLEAFHWRFHPLAKRIREIIDSGELGTIRTVHASLNIPIFSGDDIRYNYDLGGGAMMDTGCYAINCLRLLAGDIINSNSELLDFARQNQDDDEKGMQEEIQQNLKDFMVSFPKVVQAEAVLSSPQVDKHMKASIQFVNRKQNEKKNNNNNNERQNEEKEKEKAKETENETENENEKETENENEEEGKATEVIDATLTCSIFTIIPEVSASVKGTRGELNINNYVMPQLYHKIVTRIYNPENHSSGRTKWWMPTPKEKQDTVRKERLNSLFDKRSTYYYQLMAFAAAVKNGITANSSVEETLEVLPYYPYYDSIRNARLIDKVYEAAGLNKRGTTLQ